LLIVVILFIVWASIKPSVERWLKKREERIEEENFDPVKAEKFQDGILKSREKMQRELDEKAKEYQEVVEQV
jgi:F0F1-type ATP synthase membrane subunit b/b'